MTTLTAGSTATFSLSNRQVLTLTAESNTTGTLKRTQYIDGQSSKTDVLGPPATNRTYGPYGHETDIEITCTYGSFEYDVTGTSLVTAETDPVTGEIEILAPDGNRATRFDSDSWRNIPLSRSDKQFMPRRKRIMKGGKCFYPFTDHTVITKSGTNAASVTLSTVSGYNGIAADSSGSRSGSPQMVKVVGTSGATGNILLSVPSAQITQAVVSGKIGLLIYLDYASGNNPGINGLWSTSATLLNEHANTWNANQFRPGWNFLVYDAKQASHPFGTSLSYGGANDITNTAVRNFALQFSTLADVTIYLDSVWYDFDQVPEITLGWDTAEADVLQYVLPAMQSRGWRGYVAEPCQVGGSRWDDLSESGARVTRLNTFAAAGWDIINHTTTHQQIGLMANDYQIRYEIENWKAWALAHGWTKGYEFYASPQSSTSVLAERVIRESGICVQRHAKKRDVYRTPWGIDNPHHIGSVDIGNTTYATIKAAIDTNVAYRADLHLFAHTTVAGGAADGSTVPGVSTQMYYTTLILVLEYLKSLEQAGTITIADGMSGWYYG